MNASAQQDLPPLDRRLVQVRPAPRQLAWQQKEWTAFFHFGINTFTDREWGDGSESPALFNPGHVDTDQWCRVIRRAGMRGCILTAKHHDGFCLWDTRQTDHSVMHSPFGRDIVRLLADSCRRHGLALGLYLSPWDRHEATYGLGGAYNDFFCAQLTELLTGYGPLFELWFDGACGEGACGRVQQYDWPRIHALIRRHQPDACIAVCGPDVRWCGNEAGQWRRSEWSVVPASLQDCEKIQAASQQSDDADFRQAGPRSCDEALGGRARMEAAAAWAWYPAEVNTSIRPGWFYHPAEDGAVKPADRLVDIYEHTVGGNAVFLLNIPPATDGRIHPSDAARLDEVGDALRRRYRKNLLRAAAIEADAALPGHEAHCALTADDCSWRTPGGVTAATLRIRLARPAQISRVVLQEDIRQSQRIERFTLSAAVDGVQRLLYDGTTVGYQRICAFAPVETDTLVLRVLESRLAPTLMCIRAYG